MVSSSLMTNNFCCFFFLAVAASFFPTIPNGKRSSFKTFIDFMVFQKVVPNIMVKKLPCAFPGLSSQQITG